MISRKNFLKQASLLSTIALVAPSCITKPAADSNSEDGQQEENPAQMKIGLQLYSLREQIVHDVPGVIAKVSAAGYSEVETYGYSTENLFWGLSPAEFNDLLKENQLSSPSGHYDVGFFLGKSKKEDDLFKAVDSYTEAALAIGQKMIVVPWLPEEARGSIEDYQHVAQQLNRIGEHLSKSNLQLGYHNHDFEFESFGGETGYDVFLNETDADKVKLELDLYWAVRSERDPVALFKEHPGRFTMWHVKDMDKQNPGLNTEIGNGSIDFAPIFRQAKLSGLEHVYVEQENFAIDPYQSIQTSADYIKKSLLKEI